jgi:nitrate/nitrite transporter NarK
LIGNAIGKLMAVIFSNYLVLWISTYKHSGYLKSDQEAKEIYINIMLFAVIISSGIFPFVGKLCDSMDPRRIVPVAFICRALLNCYFHYLKTPNSFESYFVTISMIITCVFEDISINSIFYKSLNKDTRGLLFGL